MIEIKTKRKLRWWWFLLIPVFIIGIIVLQAIGPNPPIQVGPSTTFVTEPLDAHGLPDYAQYLMDQASEGVTPENNAAVLFLQAMGLGEIQQEYHQIIVNELGMEWPGWVVVSPDSEAMRKYVRDWIREENPSISAENLESLEQEFLDLAMGGPWAPGELPFVDTWAEANQGPLDMLVQGAARPYYFVPPPNLAAGEHPMMFALLLPDMQMMRTAARSLTMRARWHMSHGRSEEAWGDLLATYRLARHCGGKNGFLVHALVGIAIEALAHGDMESLLSQDVPAELLAQISDEFSSLPPRRPAWEFLHEGERLGALDAITQLARGRGLADGFETPGALTVASRVRVDWNIALRAVNDWYDRMVESGKLPYDQRREALETLEEELRLLVGRTQPSRVLGGIVSTRARSELISDLMLSLTLPATTAAFSADDRAQMHWHLIRISIALRRYRSEQGEYPQSLEQLVPKYLEQIPQDFYAQDLPRFERREEGFLLFSVFENGIDDGGTDFGGEIVRGEYVDPSAQVDRAKSDLVVRLPVPRRPVPTLVEAGESDD